MRPKPAIDDAMTFLRWLQPSPWVLVACKGHDPIEARLCSAADAPSFLSSQTQRGRVVRVLLGDPAPSWRASKTVPPIVQARYVGLATSIARFKELDEIARPGIWITAKDHAIAAWRFKLLPSGDEALAAIRKFGMEFGGKILPDMVPVPDLGNGFSRHSFRFDRDALVWNNTIQFARGAAPKTEVTGTAAQGRRVKEILQKLGVSCEVASINVGPVITRFELNVPEETNSSAISKAASTIARVLKCATVRVVENPRNGTVGVELPNPKREVVSFQEIITSDAFRNSKAALPLALGKSIDGAPVVVDLAKMPHLLVAGASGAGKSVGINTMILSLLHRYGPDKCNFIMIDPKMLELLPYGDLPHMLAPVVFDPDHAVKVLGWVVKEMKRRNAILSRAKAKNLAAYNEKSSERIPYLVVIIDEVADLMMVAEKDFENAVQRLSQMARAAGIHLITATQRPSSDVIKGAIKANFPARIAYTVSSGTDSRVIIGENGAEQLLGDGDMLYLGGGANIIRVHGPYAKDEEIEECVRRSKEKYGEPRYREDILELLVDGDEDVGGVERVALRSRAPDRLDVYKTLTAPMQNAVKFLMGYFESRLPATTDRIFEAGAPHGIRDGGTFYRACKMLQIESRSNGSNKPATLVPPTEWPEGFENVPVAAMA